VTTTENLEPTSATAVAASGGRIDLATASALYVAAVLGTGVLVLPGFAADAAGPASVLAVAAVHTSSMLAVYALGVGALAPTVIQRIRARARHPF
jgi:amino acid efflux transporter